MFFIMGISTSEKKIDFVQTMLCSKCGQFGRYELYMTYTYLSLFFIPLIKWNKKYYVKSTCCNTVYSIEKELGTKIVNGVKINLTEEDLHIINHSNQNSSQKCCSNCGYIAESDFTFCPKCGKQL